MIQFKMEGVFWILQTIRISKLLLETFLKIYSSVKIALKTENNYFLKVHNAIMKFCTFVLVVFDVMMVAVVVVVVIVVVFVM